MDDGPWLSEQNLLWSIVYGLWSLHLKKQPRFWQKPRVSYFACCMKRTLLALTLACLALPSFAQLADSSDNYIWNVNQWEHHVRRVYTYNGQGQYLQVKEYDPSGGIDNQLDYSYTPSGKISLLTVQTHDGNQLAPNYRNISTYDLKGNPVLNTREEYHMGQWELVAGDSLSYAYDGQNRVTYYIIHRLSDGVFKPLQKIFWAYSGTDSLPHTLTVQSYVFSNFQNFIEFRSLTWKGGFDLFSFNPSSYFGYSWNGASWDPSVYDSAIVVDGKHKVNYVFNWDGTNMDTLGRTDYTYDSKGRLRDRLNLNYIGNQWIGSDGTRDSVKYGTFDEMLERIASAFNSVNQSWVYQEKEVFYYNGLGFDIPETISLHVYPNPCRSYVSVQVDEELKDLRFTDMQGRSYPAVMKDGRIDTGSLAPGIYRISAVGLKGAYGAQVQVLP